MKNTFPTLIFAVSLLLSDCVVAAETSWQTEWKKTVAAAEKEAQLVIYTGGAVSQTRIEEAFQSAYPKVKVTAVSGRGSEFGPKIISERRAGKYLVDFFIGGKGTAQATLYPANVLAPIQPLLVLPEVLDQSKWWRGKHRYADAEGKYVFVFVGSANVVELRYNTNLVSPKRSEEHTSELQSRPHLVCR